MSVFKTLFFSFTSLSLTLSLTGQAQALKGSKPNIIVVITDDQGLGDLSFTGNPVLKTPHIDSFAKKSTRFTDFQVSPTCAPTRAAIMSGRQPFKVGVTHTIFQRERMALDVTTLPQLLKKAGYTTALFGKWHLGDEIEYLPQSRGFDEVLMHGSGGIGQVGLGDFPTNDKNVYFDNILLHNDTIVKTKGFCTDLFFNTAFQWIHKQTKTEAPYFAYISLNAPHAPLVAPESYKKRFIEMGYDEGTAARYGMIENIDDNFGNLMKKLNEWQALENTLVIFMTDNGATHLGGTLNGKKVRMFNANLRSGKNSPNEGGTHVPSFWYWPGKLKENTDIKPLVAHIDLLPTFCDLTGIESNQAKQDLDGKSLLPLLENPQAKWSERNLFIHCGRWGAGEREQYKFKKCAVRSSRWRLVNNKQLYDISADPGEKKDVASAYPEVVEKLRKAYDQWWKESLPLMVNEDLPKVTRDEMPLALRYHKQLKEKGIPNWSPK